MKALLKLLLLFVLDWLLIAFFYVTTILVVILNVVVYVTRSQAMGSYSIFIDILIIALIGYFVNKRFIKASKPIFVIAQILFGISLVVLFVAAIGAVAHGIMNA